MRCSANHERSRRRTLRRIARFVDRQASAGISDATERWNGARARRIELVAAGRALQLETIVRRDEHFQGVRVHFDGRTEIRDRHNASAAGSVEDVEARLAVRTADFCRFGRCRRGDHGRDCSCEIRGRPGRPGFFPGSPVAAMPYPSPRCDDNSRRSASSPSCFSRSACCPRADTLGTESVRVDWYWAPSVRIVDPSDAACLDGYRVPNQHARLGRNYGIQLVSVFDQRNKRGTKRNGKGRVRRPAPPSGERNQKSTTCSGLGELCRVHRRVRLHRL